MIFFKEEVVMAKIIENSFGRRMIRLNTNDVISIVREYQNVSCKKLSYENIRAEIDKLELYLFEDMS
jgi:hypothetical protein